MTTWAPYKQTICLINYMCDCHITDRVQEGMRELESLKDKRDVNICAILTLILAHKKARNVGKLEQEKYTHNNVTEVFINEVKY